ncbi:hypothetical protein SAMN05428987_5249 [Paenibacillus sp. CF095]|uniref:hypothetical protein n=1 Tax=Paenibacillus sp. CF095 TaxID=1881033 RepID=UPI0008815B38|nr:hypothetical protein [Paenibacillus sp. CF095]SDD55009.1 hypothetical protein SAMN05428987_5249 [Paenibacillus sp. CF095]
MDKELIPLLSAAIVAGTTLIVLIINKIVEYSMWKTNLDRKGEEKYLERKIDTLHITIVDIFELTAETLTLGNQSDQGIRSIIKEGFKSVDDTFRKVIAKASPFLDKKIMDNEVHHVYMLTASIWELMRQHDKEGNVKLSIIESEDFGYKEIKTLEEIISTHIFWLNEALHELKDELAILVNPIQKSAPQWRSFTMILSIIVNCLLAIALIFSWV